MKENALIIKSPNLVNILNLEISINFALNKITAHYLNNNYNAL